jgi:hypothetical protein
LSEHGGFGGPPPSGGITGNLNALIHPPTEGPAPIQDLASILLDPTQHFRLDLDQALQAIAVFRQAAAQLRDLIDEAEELGNVRPPGLDAVSVNAAKEIGLWATSRQPNSFCAAMESGAIQMEKVADALEQSLANHRNVDEANATHLRGSEL